MPVLSIVGLSAIFALAVAAISCCHALFHFIYLPSIDIYSTRFSAWIFGLIIVGYVAIAVACVRWIVTCRIPITRNLWEFCAGTFVVYALVASVADLMLSSLADSLS